MSINSSPLNGKAVNAVAGPYVPQEYSWAFTEEPYYADTVAYQTGINFDSSYNQSDALNIYVSWAIGEGYNLETIVSSKGTFILDVINNFDYSNDLSLAILFNLTESLTFTGDATLDRETVMAFIEAIVLADSNATKLNAMFAIAETLSNIDSIEASFGYNFAEAIGIAGVLGIDAQAVLSILESYLNIDSLAMKANVFISATEGINIADILETKGTLLADFSEEIIISGILNTPEGTFEAWTVNAESRAPWQYTNFPFNSFAMIDGTYYGADESGLFSLDGDTDDGEKISAVIKSGLINMGTTTFKRIPRAYFGYTSSGQLLFHTITTECGKKLERWYELPRKTADDTTNNRLKLARGVKSVYWQFEIVNVDGADFDFDEIKLMPTILKRRR